MKKLAQKTIEKLTSSVKELTEIHRKDLDIIMNSQQKLQINERNLEEIKREKAQTLEKLSYKKDSDERIRTFNQK